MMTNRHRAFAAVRQHAGMDGAIPSPATTCERWGLCELAFDAPQAARTANPFLDVDLQAVFSDGATTLTMRGFFDGGSTWRLRFMPPVEGRWSWRTSSTAPELDGLRGTIMATPPADDNHGPVRVAHRHHFAHADGRRHVSVGTTCYGWTHQPLERQEQTLESLAAAPFNKLRMCVFPKWYEFHRDPPLHHAFLRGADGRLDWGRPDLAYFQLLDRRIAELARLGIEADLILFHPYDNHDAPAAERWGYDEMPAWAEDAYLRHLVARVAAYRNVWWSLANEWDIMKAKTPEDWARFARVLKAEDPYGHPVSIHNCGRMYDHADPAISHVSAQRIDTVRTSEDTVVLRERFAKPVVWDEVAYEGDVCHGWGNLTAEELVRRFWEGMVRGGYVGHGETYAHPQDILWWSRGGALHGQSPARIAFLRGLVETCPGPGIEPLPGDWDAPLGGCAGAWLLQYYGFNRPRWRCFRLPADGDFQIEVIDTWNMTRTPVPGVHRGNLRVELPGRSYMAILARRVAATGRPNASAPPRAAG